MRATYNALVRGGFLGYIFFDREQGCMDMYPLRAKKF